MGAPPCGPERGGGGLPECRKGRRCLCPLYPGVAWISSTGIPGVWHITVKDFPAII
jgi:hypothetical protein